MSDNAQVIKEIEGFPKLLTTSQAAKYLGIHPETLTKYALEGAIAHLVTPSGRRRYRVRDLDAAILRWSR